jgi:hypothetical protein
VTANVSRVRSCNKLNNPAGDISKELMERKVLDVNKSVDAIYTITVGCSGFLTLICC